MLVTLVHFFSALSFHLSIRPEPVISPVAVLGLLGHPGQRGLQTAQMVVELACVTQHQQMLVLVFLTDATTAGKFDKRRSLRRSIRAGFIPTSLLTCRGWLAGWMTSPVFLLPSCWASSPLELSESLEYLISTNKQTKQLQLLL